MDHNVGSEGIEVMKLGITLGVLSVILVYVIFNVSLGKEIQGVVYDKTSTAEVSAANAPLQELSGEPLILPAATVYSLLMYNGSSIGTIACFVCYPHGERIHTADENLCIVNHLKGKIKVSIRWNSYTGLYDVILGNEEVVE